MTWRRQVVKQVEEIEQKMKNAIGRPKQSNAVTYEDHEVNPATSVKGNTGSKTLNPSLRQSLQTV